MRVKKYRANSVKEAVDLMKAEFGNDAVILHTKCIKQGGFFGLFGRNAYEIVGAIDPNIEKTQKSSSISDNHQAVKLNRLSDETKVQSDWTNSIQKLYQKLQKQDIPHTLAIELIKSVLSRIPKKQWNELQWLSDALKSTIISQLLIEKSWDFTKGSKTVVLVGPTGVGKTTTIAKIAANYQLIANKKVGLITLDIYRIAAVEQLKTYADIMNIPLRIAYSGEELKTALNDYQDRDLILIDTAGCSHLNKQQMFELESALTKIRARTYLVLSATMKNQDLTAVINSFKQLGIDSLIITKLDETQQFGVIIQAAYYAKLPIAFITNGQSVPDDIEVANATRLTNMVLGD